MVRILIAGATGLVGSHALALALADSRVSGVVAPTRRPLPPHPKLLNPVTDFTPFPAESGWLAVDGVACALGTTAKRAGSAEAFRAVDLDLPLAIARAARDRGARSFALVSSTGANPRSRFLYPRTKGELEEALRAPGYPSLTILRPGLLGGARAEFRPAERAAAVILGLLGPALPRSLRISPAEKVAARLLDAAVTAAPGVHVVEAGAFA